MLLHWLSKRGLLAVACHRILLLRLSEELALHLSRRPIEVSISAWLSEILIPPWWITAHKSTGRGRVVLLRDKTLIWSLEETVCVSWSRTSWRWILNIFSVRPSFTVVLRRLTEELLCWGRLSKLTIWGQLLESLSWLWSSWRWSVAMWSWNFTWVLIAVLRRMSCCHVLFFLIDILFLMEWACRLFHYAFKWLSTCLDFIKLFLIDRREVVSWRGIRLHSWRPRNVCWMYSINSWCHRV